jgi:hypothetical protein
MPSNPPMELPTNEAESESTPNSTGAYPPAMEPITIAIIIIFFLDIVSTNGLFAIS